jgi:hypothetical protein
MAMKKAQLERLKASRIESGMRREQLRNDAGATGAADRREQRRRDKAAGLVPFAVKLNGELVKRVRAQSEARQVAVDVLVAELLERALDPS